MRKHFVAVREDVPSGAWLARFRAGRVEAERWYREGRADPPSGEACRAALARSMPELVASYDRACALAEADDLDRAILSQYRPPPQSPGCSAAVWLGKGGPALLRNYDYPLDVVTGRFELSCWSGRQVVTSAQRPWGGCLDGMNEDGLAACVTLGGGAQGEGFAVILMLRYVLETCARVGEAAAALARIPIARSQNVVLLDRAGDHAILFLGPDRAPAVTGGLVCTNHQEVAPPGSDTQIRHHTLAAALAEPGMTLPALARRFLESPLYSRRAAAPTAYTAVYRPREGAVDYLWPGRCWTQSFAQFEEGAYVHDYGALAA